jgi:hypothetical protein
MSDDIESRVQKFCAAHQATIKFAIKNNIIRLDSRMLGDDGMKNFKNGMRDLISTIDNSEHPAVGYEALQKIITGVTLVSVGAAYAETAKTAIIRQWASAAGKISAKFRQAEAEEGWLTHALKLAVAIRTEDKAITQADLAAKIKERWALKIKCPKSQLIPAISRWEREGKLPRRNK